MAKDLNMDKVALMRIALGMCGLGVSDSTAEIIVRVQEELEKKGGDFSLSDAVSIECEVMQKYNGSFISVESIKKIYDKISKKPEDYTTEEILGSLKILIETEMETNT